MPLSSLRQQLIGAAAGTAVALGMYGAYSLTAPMVRGMLALEAVAEERAPSKFTDSDRRARIDEIVTRARQSILLETSGEVE